MYFYFPQTESWLFFIYFVIKHIVIVRNDLKLQKRTLKLDIYVILRNTQHAVSMRFLTAPLDRQCDR